MTTYDHDRDSSAGGDPAELSGSATDSESVTEESRAEHRFRNWRRSRPFWGALLVTLAGAEILLSVQAPISVVQHAGAMGIATYLVPIVILLCGLLLVFSPEQRPFYAVVAVVLSLTSWLTSNLGGFVVGMLLGLVGGALAFAWSPTKQSPTKQSATKQSPPEHR